MLVTLLGTGCPQCHPRRFGPASLVQAAGRDFLVDCGSGVTQRLMGAGGSGAALDALLLTLLHSDQVVDLYQLIISSWHQGRDRPQRIFGPAGTRAFTEACMELWRNEREQRIAYEHRPSAKAFELEIVEFEEGVIWDAGGLRISAFEVDHRPFRPAFGFRFETEACKVVFSGDTTICSNLIKWAEGADLLVHECFIHHEMAALPGLRTTEGLKNVAAYHTLSSDVGKVAREAGARLLVLNHLVPVEFDRGALLEEVCRDFPGPVVIGEDLLAIDAARRAVAFADLRLALGQG
jgi:ribonuclease Z